MSPDEGQKEMEEVEEELSEHDAKAKKDGDLMEEGRPSVSATYLLTYSLSLSSHLFLSHPRPHCHLTVPCPIFLNFYSPLSLFKRSS
jgi:hypothetical protein